HAGLAESIRLHDAFSGDLASERRRQLTLLMLTCGEEDSLAVDDIAHVEHHGPDVPAVVIDTRDGGLVDGKLLSAELCARTAAPAAPPRGTHDNVRAPRLQ